MAVSAAACTKDPATQVVVVLHAEAALLAQATSVHVTIRDDEGALVVDRSKALVQGEAAVAHVPLIPKGDNPARRFALSAVLVDATDKELARVEARSGYADRELRELHVWFDDACRGVSCGEGRTCQAGTCVGSCFSADPSGSTPRAHALCGECETCDATCVPASGIACGCPGETCSSGTCVPRERVRHVAAGMNHTCASLDSRDVYCWGSNQFDADGGNGQLGTGDESPTISRPRRVEGADGWRAVAAGVHHTCSLNEGAERFCWGANYKGEIAAPARVALQRTALQSSLPSLDTIVAGLAHTCGMQSNTTDLHCWGANHYGQVGNGRQAAGVFEPTLVGSGYASVTASGEHTCALRTDGTVHCWGFNDSGELGALVGTSSPVPVRPGCETSNLGNACFHDYQRLGLGWFHSCAIREGGALYCWGGNFNGQLGFKPATDFNQVEPTAIGAGIVWNDVAGGRSHTCALDDQGTLFCWGLNVDRQLGFASDGIVYTPTRVEVSAASRFVALALGEFHSCAVRTDRTLWCWGKNNVGQIGIGSVAPTPVAQPTRVCF